MKYNFKQYAEILYELVEGKKAPEAKLAIRQFADFLAANNDLARAEQIIEKFSEFWDRKNGIIRSEISSARELDNSTKKSIKDFIKNKADCQEVDITEQIDESLLGGAIIRFGDKVIDASLRANLADLKDRMVK